MCSAKSAKSLKTLNTPSHCCEFLQMDDWIIVREMHLWPNQWLNMFSAQLGCFGTRVKHVLEKELVLYNPYDEYRWAQPHWVVRKGPCSSPTAGIMTSLLFSENKIEQKLVSLFLTAENVERLDAVQQDYIQTHEDTNIINIMSRCEHKLCLAS